MSDLLTTPGDTTWFTKDRFGLFIHWGLYAMGARHEWMQNNERRMPEEYRDRYFTRFDPDLYDPKLWAAAAADAGMKYFVVTARHHEGFCLWDTKHTDYKAPNSPARRDLLRPMVEAFRERGIRAGLYYSLLDWYHGDYVLDERFGPCRDNAEERAKRNVGRDQSRYAAYMRDQVRELLTEYGQIDVLWFDFSYPHADGVLKGKGRADWESDKLYALVRELAPKIVLDDRLDLPGGWDVKTPEQFQPRSWVTHEGRRVVWEACQTMSGSWGYFRDELTWRSADELIRTLIDSVSKGGNLLLNVGPNARGELDPRALSRLTDIGRWMRLHGRSIYGCTEAPADIVCPPDCRLTWNPDTRRLYVHLLAWPYKGIWIPGLKQRAAYAQLLHDGSEVQMNPLADWQLHMAQGQFGSDDLGLALPQVRPDVAVPVIEVFLK